MAKASHGTDETDPVVTQEMKLILILWSPILSFLAKIHWLEFFTCYFSQSHLVSPEHAIILFVRQRSVLPACEKVR